MSFGWFSPRTGLELVGLGASKEPLWAEFENFRLDFDHPLDRNRVKYTTHCIHKISRRNLDSRLLGVMDEAGANLVEKCLDLFGFIEWIVDDLFGRNLKFWPNSLDGVEVVWAEFENFRLGNGCEKMGVKKWVRSEKTGREKIFNLGEKIKFRPNL